MSLWHKIRMEKIMPISVWYNPGLEKVWLDWDEVVKKLKVEGIVE